MNVNVPNPKNIDSLSGHEKKCAELAERDLASMSVYEVMTLSLNLLYAAYQQEEEEKVAKRYADAFPTESTETSEVMH